MVGYALERVGAGQHARGQALGLQAGGQILAGGLVDHDGEAGAELRALAQQRLHLARGAQREHLEAAGMAGDDVQGVGADGAGRAQDSDALRGHAR